MDSVEIGILGGNKENYGESYRFQWKSEKKGEYRHAY